MSKHLIPKRGYCYVQVASNLPGTPNITTNPCWLPTQVEHMPAEHPPCQWSRWTCTHACPMHVKLCKTGRAGPCVSSCQAMPPRLADPFTLRGRIEPSQPTRPTPSSQLRRHDQNHCNPSRELQMPHHRKLQQESEASSE